MLVQNNLLVGVMTASAANPDAARRDQYIKASGAASCSYYTTDLFLGPTAPSVMENHGPWVKQGFDTVVLALKARAEALHRERLAQGRAADYVSGRSEQRGEGVTRGSF